MPDNILIFTTVAKREADNLFAKGKSINLNSAT